MVWARPPRISRGDGAVSSRSEAGRRDDRIGGIQHSGTRRAAARSPSVSMGTTCTSQRGHNSAGASRGTLRGPEAGSRSALPCRGAARGGRSNEWGVPWMVFMRAGGTPPAWRGSGAPLPDATPSEEKRHAARDLRAERLSSSGSRLPAACQSRRKVPPSVGMRGGRERRVAGGGALVPHALTGLGERGSRGGGVRKPEEMASSGKCVPYTSSHERSSRLAARSPPALHPPPSHAADAR